MIDFIARLGLFRRSVPMCGQLATLILVATIALGSMTAWAATDQETGANGANGPNGQIINNGGLIEVTPGAPGVSGGSVNAIASSNDVTNTATGTGGIGGNGGNGVSRRCSFKRWRQRSRWWKR